LRLAAGVSKELYSKEVAPLQLFLGVLINKNSLGSRTMQAMGIEIPSVVKHFVGNRDFEFMNPRTGKKEIALSKESKSIVRQAYSISNKYAHVYVGTEHIVLAILKEKNQKLAIDLENFGLDYQSFEEMLMNYATYPLGILAKPGMPIPQGGDQSILSLLGEDLVSLAKEGKLDPVVGREEEIDHVINILSRRKKNNPVIVGEAGVGKTVLVEALAQRIAEGSVPGSLQDTKIVSIDVASIVAGSKMRGDVEEKVMAVIKEVMSSPNVILFIDEIHTILGLGAPGPGMDIASILKPALVKDDFRVIGATTTAEYTKY